MNITALDLFIEPDYLKENGFSEDTLMRYYAAKKLAGFAKRLYGNVNWKAPYIKYSPINIQLKPCENKHEGTYVELEFADKVPQYPLYLLLDTKDSWVGSFVLPNSTLAGRNAIFLPFAHLDSQNPYTTLWIKLERWFLKCSKGLDQAGNIMGDIRKAIDKVNSVLSQEYVDDPLWALFFSEPIGWNIEVEIDDQKSLDVARKEWEGKNSNDNVTDPGIDLLGVYHSTNHRIILYSKAIEQFCNGLQGNKKLELSNVFAYILAHELFHAYQDFHVCLSLWGRSLEAFPVQQNDIQHIETYAEYFALHYISSCLKDKDLFDALCKEHKSSQAGLTSNQTNALTPYVLALDVFGEIKNSDSCKEFLSSNTCWMEYWLNLV